jgi:hypothetical protein
VPSAKIFIGDAALAGYLVFNTSWIGRPWLDALVRRSPLSPFCWPLLISLCYGLIETLRGLSLEDAGYRPLASLQELTFHIYPIYFFIGIQTAVTYPNALPKIIRFLSLASCIWGVIYYAALQNVRVMIPGTNVDLIMAPSGSGMALSGMTYLDLRTWWPVVVMSLFFVLGGQIRSGWMAIGAGMLLQAILTGRLRRLIWSVGSVAALLLAGYWSDFSVPAPAGRGGVVSSREIVGRAIAAVDQEKASEYTPRSATYAGTVTWRTRWWNSIWDSVHEDATKMAIGHGYGFPLTNLVAYLRTEEELRTPHSVFYYTLGYTGWIGVAVFAALQAGLGVVLWRVFRATGQPFGLVFWLMALIGAMFGAVFETPMGAIPHYLMLGMAAASLVSPAVFEVDAESAREWRPRLFRWIVVTAGAGRRS